MSARVEKAYRQFALEGRFGTLPIYGPSGRAIDGVALRLFGAEVPGARTRATRVMIECDAGRLRVAHQENVNFGGPSLVPRDLETSLLNLTGPATLFIDRFEQLPLSEQAVVIRQFRARREKLSGIPFQLVVIGAWRPFALREHWRRSEVSSPFDEVRLTEIDLLSPEEVELRLEEAIDGFSGDHAGAIAALVQSQTAGDPDLVELYLALASGAKGPDALEEIAVRLEDQDCVQALVLERLASLSDADRACDLLAAILQHQTIVLPGNDLDAELLFTTGLARPLDRLRSSRPNIWVPASPVLAGALRRAWRRRPGCTTTPWPDEILPTSHPVVVQAAALVCEIENFLRNSIALGLGKEGAGEPLEERITAFAPSVAGDARNRRHRDVEMSLPLVAAPFLSFFEISDIEGVVAGELWANHFSRLFGEKNDFLSALHEFGRLRTAVAHNKIYSVRVLADLRRLLRNFRTAVGMAAARSVNSAKGTSLDVTSFKLTPIPGRDILLRVTVRASGPAVSSARVVFSLLSASGTVVAGAAFGNPVTLAAGEEKPLTVKFPPGTVTDGVARVEAIAHRW